MPCTPASFVSMASTSVLTASSFTLPEVGDQTTVAVLELASWGLTSSRKFCARADWVLGSENESLNLPSRVMAKNPAAPIAMTQTSSARIGRRMAQADSGPIADPPTPWLAGRQ